MQNFHGIPHILGRYSPEPAKPKAPSNPFGQRKAMPTKYDHAAMLQDRMAGMTWLAIGHKHNVPNRRAGSDVEYAFTVSNMVLVSAAANRLKPSQVARLEEVQLELRDGHK